MASKPASVRARRCARTLACIALLGLGAGCVSHHHVVGVGPTGVGEESVRQYYILFGMIAFNEVDTLRMAGGLNGYAVETSYTLTDMLLMPFLLPLTTTSRTVTVLK